MAIRAKAYTNRKNIRKVSVNLDEDAANTLASDLKGQDGVVGELGDALVEAGFGGSPRRKRIKKAAS